MSMVRAVHYRLSDGTIVGKVETPYYFHTPISDEKDTDWIEHPMDSQIDWYSIGPATHVVCLKTFVVLKK